MSAVFSGTPDVSMQRRNAGVGMNTDLLFMCGHKGARAGAAWRRPGGQQIVWVRCAACEAARKDKK